MLFFLAAALSAAFTKSVEQVDPVVDLAHTIEGLTKTLAEEFLVDLQTKCDTGYVRSRHGKEI